MSDTLREQIITSPTAKRMLERVSPIYDDAYVALWMFQAIGLEYDKLWDIINDIPNQLFPNTATWTIQLWEQRYGLPSDDNMSIEERRRKIQLKRRHPGPFNPSKVESIAEMVTGLSARVAENIDDYTFAIYLSATSSNDEELRKLIKSIKPSHLSFEIRYEQGASSDITIGGNINEYRNFVLNQVN